ncbi:MAG: hypothetical protein IKC11_01820 [Clostridia bacterium]|nr:hypothetical protein [Clostridia bacterium]
MKRKIAVTIIICAIGLPLLFFFGSAVILFLAPGVEIFGVRYVSAALNITVENGAQNLTSFPGDEIFIETHGVPITIQFTDYYNTSVVFTQDFIGYTKSKYERPYLDVKVDSNGDLRITAKELVKFIHAAEGNDMYEFVLTLSSAFIKNKGISIKSHDSPVTIIGTAEFSYFSLVSEGSLTIQNKLIAPRFKYHTMKSITVGSKIETSTVDLKSMGGYINIQKEISGDITAETVSGDIKFISCANLTAKSKSGSIKCSGEGLTLVRGQTKIETTAGSVHLGHVSTSGNDKVCYIKTSSGSINVNTMVDGEIASQRGRVVIDTARNLVINNRVGNVTVGKVANGIVVNGRNGKVNLGETGIVNNPTVNTTSGTIKVANATGKVILKSTSQSVNFVNASSTNITLYAGKGLTAKNLQGDVDAYANGDVSMHFMAISGNVTLNVGSKSDNVEVDASCASISSVDYYLRSTKGKKAKLYAGNILVDSKSKIDSGTSVDKKKISIKSSYAKIVLKLGV